MRVFELLVAARRPKQSNEPMNNQPHDEPEPEMSDEYDFTGKIGVRGNYAARLRNGYTIVVHRADGTTTTERHMPASMIVLNPDVQAYFPDANAVNQALRAMIVLDPDVQSIFPMPMLSIEHYGRSSAFCQPLPTPASATTIPSPLRHPFANLDSTYRADYNRLVIL